MEMSGFVGNIRGICVGHIDGDGVERVVVNVMKQSLPRKGAEEEAKMEMELSNTELTNNPLASPKRTGSYL